MHSINLIKQAPLSLLHLIQQCSLMPCTAHHARTAEKSEPEIQKQWRGLFKTRHGRSACFAFLLWGDLKNYVLCYPSVDPLIIVKQVMLKFLSKLGKGGLSMQNILLYGNESTMWQLLNSSESRKQMLLVMVGKEVFAASKSKLNAYLCLYLVCLTLFFIFSSSPILLWSRV